MSNLHIHHTHHLLTRCSFGQTVCKSVYAKRLEEWMCYGAHGHEQRVQYARRVLVARAQGKADARDTKDDVEGDENIRTTDGAQAEGCPEHDLTNVRRPVDVATRSWKDMPPHPGDIVTTWNRKCVDAVGERVRDDRRPLCTRHEWQQPSERPQSEQWAASGGSTRTRGRKRRQPCPQSPGRARDEIQVRPDITSGRRDIWERFKRFVTRLTIRYEVRDDAKHVDGWRRRNEKTSPAYVKHVTLLRVHI